MAITLSTAARNAACDAITALIDVGAGSPSEGQLIFRTSGDAEVARCIMANPAFGAAATGVCTAGAIQDDTNAVGGTIAKFVIQDGDGNEILNGTCGAGSGDISFNSVIVSAAQTVSVSSLTVTVPAS